MLRVTLARDGDGLGLVQEQINGLKHTSPFSALSLRRNTFPYVSGADECVSVTASTATCCLLLVVSQVIN